MRKKLFPILLIGLLFTSYLFLVIEVLGISMSNETGFKIQKSYSNLGLNNTVALELNSTSYTDEINLNFTSINETKDFISNGEFDSNSSGWDAQNETDVNYKWMSDGPNNSKCISINLTGQSSKILFRPMNNSKGVENFKGPSSINSWKLHNNDTMNFTQGYFSGENHGNPGSGSLMHEYQGDRYSGGMANSSYQFFYDSQFEITSINLTFFYLWNVQLSPFSSNTLEIGVFLVTPSQTYLINNWSEIFKSNPIPESSWHNITLSGFDSYFNETGNYNITFYSIHSQVNADTTNVVYFDDIELNVTWGLKEFSQNDTTTWNQSINFNRNVFENGILNYSLQITDKFDHINTSNVFLSTWINNQLIQATPITTITSNTWIPNSMIVNKTIIGSGIIDVSLGLLFNATTYIFANETFSLFIDNVSFIIGSNPHPTQINLKIYDNGVNKSYTVIRDIYNNDFVKIIEPEFTWGPNYIDYINVTCNSSQVKVFITVTYLVFKIGNDGNDGNVNPPNLNPEDFISLLVFLVLMLIISSSLFVVRFQKRLFLNPKYDYIRKLRVKTRLRARLERGAPIEAKKRCPSCGKYINAAAKFCEFCGKPQ